MLDQRFPNRFLLWQCMWLQRVHGDEVLTTALVGAWNCAGLAQRFWWLHLRDAVPGVVRLKVFRTVIFIPSFLLWITEEKGAWSKGTCLKPDCKPVITGKYNTRWWEDWGESPFLLAYLQDPSWLGGSRWDCYKNTDCLITQARQLQQNEATFG